MNPRKLSQQYFVRKLIPDDTEIIFDLSCKNELFYKYHPPFVTRQSILDDMNALPPGKTYEDKVYAGYFAKDRLVAIMDLILDYPVQSVAFIGLFMVDTAFQKQGTGTELIRECASYLRSEGFSKIRLAIDQGNPQSEAFWTRNNFVKTGEVCSCGDTVVFPMELIL